jgi:hypothetical protein
LAALFFIILSVSGAGAAFVVARGASKASRVVALSAVVLAPLALYSINYGLGRRISDEPGHWSSFFTVLSYFIVPLVAYWLAVASGYFAGRRARKP